MKNKKRNYNKLNTALESIFLIIILILIAIFIIGLIPSKKKGEPVDTYNFNNTVKEYFRVNNRVIYLYNIDELNITYEESKLSFKDYLTKFNDDLEAAFKNMEESLKVKSALRDGGTVIYETKDNHLFNEDLTIIKCHTSDGNEDIYFGKNMNAVNAFKDGACGKNYFEDKEFSRVYTLSNIKDLGIKEGSVYNPETDTTEVKMSHYYELTIKDENGKTVTLERVMDDDSRKSLIKGKDYTFYFENKYGELIKNDIEDIVNKCTIKKIVLRED